MHIHIYINLGFWQRIGIVATLLSGFFVAVFAINHLPAQTDVFPCLTQIEAIKDTVTPHQDPLNNCDIDIINAAVKIHQFSFIVETLLKWLAAIFAVYGVFLTAAWVWAGRAKK